MGKQKILRVGCFSKNRRRAAILAGLCLLTGCAGTRPDRFSGLMRLQSGTCDPPSRAVLSINDRFVHFTPHEGVLTLDGTITDSGAIQAQAALPGMDHHLHPHALTATLHGSEITGTYQSPRCRYRVTLSATP